PVTAVRGKLRGLEKVPHEPHLSPEDAIESMKISFGEAPLDARARIDQRIDGRHVHARGGQDELKARGAGSEIHGLEATFTQRCGGERPRILEAPRCAVELEAERTDASEDGRGQPRSVLPRQPSWTIRSREHSNVSRLEETHPPARSERGAVLPGPLRKRLGQRARVEP